MSGGANILHITVYGGTGADQSTDKADRTDDLPHIARAEAQHWVHLSVIIAGDFNGTASTFPTVQEMLEEGEFVVTGAMAHL